MRDRREISPALNATAEEYLRVLPAPIQGIVKNIRAEKDEGTPPHPSSKLIDRSSLLTSGKRIGPGSGYGGALLGSNKGRSGTAAGGTRTIG